MNLSKVEAKLLPAGKQVRVESIDISGETHFFLHSLSATEKKIAEANDVKSFHGDFMFDFRQVRYILKFVFL